MLNICAKHQSAIKDKLKNFKLKVTPARLELLDLLEHYESPVTIEKIGKLMKNKKVDFTTLYRNLESLKGLGLVREVSLNRSQAYYELADKPHHHHLICQTCGIIKDVSNCATPKISDKTLIVNGFKKVDFHSLEFFGQCNKCSPK